MTTSQDTEPEGLYLHTKTARFIKQVKIIPERNPDVIIWGDRVFKNDFDSPQNYYECDAAFVSSPPEEPSPSDIPSRKVFLLGCEIQRGGFSSERTFTIKTTDGGTLTGLANVHYCYNKEKMPLWSDRRVEPLKENETIVGYIECRVLEEIGDRVTVDLPSSDTLCVSEKELVEMPTQREESNEGTQ